ncbi:hypothetical protein [Marinobacterium sp. BA1]|uniref:hypothetical protein n=1 Tax=Marinobacterium sp. BA1 TaxID=3138931 RepID=UPI0034E86C43
MDTHDALERVIASMLILVGLLVTLLILIVMPGSPSSAFAIGFGSIAIMLSVRSLLIGNKLD